MTADGIVLSHFLRPPDASDDGYRDVLLSWCAVNQLPADRCTDRRQIEVDMTGRTITYFRALDDDDARTARTEPGGRNGVDLEPTTIPLLHDPLGRLIADDPTCGHYLAHDQGARACVREVDPIGGLHRGVHQADGGAMWGNNYPGVFDWAGGSPDVAGRSPGDQHVLVLTALERVPVVARYLGEPAPADTLWKARGLILERHAPTSVAGPAHCRNYYTEVNPGIVGHFSPWPCPDYRDAAQGLVTGLGDIDGTT